MGLEVLVRALLSPLYLPLESVRPCLGLDLERAHSGLPSLRFELMGACWVEEVNSSLISCFQLDSISTRDFDKLLQGGFRICYLMSLLVLKIAFLQRLYVCQTMALWFLHHKLFLLLLRYQFWNRLQARYHPVIFWQTISLKPKVVTDRYNDHLFKSPLSSFNPKEEAV